MALPTLKKQKSGRDQERENGKIMFFLVVGLFSAAIIFAFLSKLF